MFDRLREDIACIRERDPAARSTWEVLTCYPGLHALVLHRRAHGAWRHGLHWLGRFISHVAAGSPASRSTRRDVGRRVFIDHGMGVVIGETAEIGDDCTIYQGVTLGGTSLARAPSGTRRSGRGVIVGAERQVLGGFTVGDGARVGSNAVLLQAGAAGRDGGGQPGAHHPPRRDATREQRPRRWASRPTA